MKRRSETCFVCATMVIISVLLVSCGGGGGGGTTAPASTTNAYVGTQTAGDFWTWSVTTVGGGAETFTATNEHTGYTYSGTAVALAGNATGFTKLTYTASTDPGVTAGATAYEIEMPGTMVMAVPGPFTQLNNGDGILYVGSNNPPVMAIAQGTCPTSSGSFNWIMVPPKGWCSGGDAQGTCPDGPGSVGSAYGTAQITVSGTYYDMTVQPYYLSGTPQASFTMTGATCSSGVITGTDSLGRTLNVAFTPSGLFFIDLPRGKGSMVGADASTPVDFTNFLKNGRTFIGWSFMSIRDFNNPSYTAPDTSAVQAVANGTTIIGSSFLDLDSGVLQTGAGTTLNLVSQPSPGLITYTTVESDGTHNGVFVIKQIGGKYYFFSIIDHWEGSHTGADEMAGQNIFGVETTQ